MPFIGLAAGCSLRGVPNWLVRSPQERAIFGFAGKTLARSQKHQFFIATYFSAGLSIALFFGVAIHDGRLALSPDGARTVAFVLGFFAISGFRAVFQFPAELASNWIFRMTEARWTEVSRNATRKLVLAMSLVPLLLLALPLEIAAWHWPTVLEHLAVQLMAAALLVEVLFWNFDKVPFTCSYFPGNNQPGGADCPVYLRHHWLQLPHGRPGERDGTPLGDRGPLLCWSGRRR